MAVSVFERRVSPGVILEGTDTQPQEKVVIPKTTPVVMERRDNGGLASLDSGGNPNFDEQRIREAAYFEWEAKGRPFQSKDGEIEDWEVAQDRLRRNANRTQLFNLDPSSSLDVLTRE